MSATMPYSLEAHGREARTGGNADAGAATAASTGVETGVARARSGMRMPPPLPRPVRAGPGGQVPPGP